MKTIEEAAKDFNDSHVNGHHPQKWVSDIFKAGVEFAQRWIPVEEELPELKEKQYSILAKTKTNEYIVVNVFGDIEYLRKGIFEYFNITHWRPITLE